jgi:hypothetical protein
VRVPASLQGGEIAFYGEPLFGAALAEQIGLRLAEPPLDWLASLNRELRGREVKFCSLEEARHVPQPAFIKPAGDKSFEARVYSSGAGIARFRRGIDGGSRSPSRCVGKWSSAASCSTAR